MPYTETQLAKLIEDVEKEFTAHLAKSEGEVKTSTEVTEMPGANETTTLSKAEESDKKPEEKKDEEPKSEHKEEPKAEAKPEESKEESKEVSAEAKPEDKKLEGEDAPHSEEGCDYDEEDMEHMHKMYSSMSKAELKAHHDCIAALAKCGDMSQEKAPMAKSEEIKPVEVVVESTNTSTNEVELLKSELTGANTKYEELKKNFDAVAEFLTKLVEKKAAPAAKAITSLEVIAKSEGTSEEKTLTKSEIHEALIKKSSDPTLKKSDRDLINAYYLGGGSIGIESINHLLK